MHKMHVFLARHVKSIEQQFEEQCKLELWTKIYQEPLILINIKSVRKERKMKERKHVSIVVNQP